LALYGICGEGAREEAEKQKGNAAPKHHKASVFYTTHCGEKVNHFAEIRTDQKGFHMSDIKIFRLTGDTVSALEGRSAGDLEITIKSASDLERAKSYIIKSYEAS